MRFLFALFTGALCALAVIRPAAAQADGLRETVQPVFECHVAELVVQQTTLCARLYPALAGRAQRAERNWTARNATAAAERAANCRSRLAGMQNRDDAEGMRLSMDETRKAIIEATGNAYRAAPEACSAMLDDLESRRGSYEVNPRLQE